MDKVNVVWLSYHKPEILARGYWDQALLEDLFERANFEFEHCENVLDPNDGAVVVVNGRTHFEDVEKINAAISVLDWCLFIVTGDEEALFPWQDIKHPMLRTWVMLPRMNQHNDVALKLPNGYRPETRELLKQTGDKERDLDWFFAGQINHERRQQCFDVLKQFETIYPNTKTVGTDGFGKEVVAYPEYVNYMSRAKIMPCPSGIESPDNFRLYEALEAGCLPVVDAFSTQNKTPGFWNYLFGEAPPFPVVDYWDKFPIILPELLKDYPANANRASAWWQKKKRDMVHKLEDHIKELSK